jgi:uncharacterized surface protein with fasciclin (FAS1) repeats
MKKLLSSTALFALIAGGAANAEASITEAQSTAEANAMVLQQLRTPGTTNAGVSADIDRSDTDERGIWQAMASLDWAPSGEQTEQKRAIKVSPTMYQPGLVVGDESDNQDLPLNETAFDEAADPNGIDTTVQLLEVADLDEVLQQGSEFTVFAPTNAAFKEVDEKQLNRFVAGYDQDELEEILKAHIVKGDVSRDQLGTSGKEFTSISDTDLTIREDAIGQIRVENAFVVASDTSADGGTIHIVDKIIQIDG